MNICGAKGSIKYSQGDFWRWKAPESQEFASFRALRALEDPNSSQLNLAGSADCMNNKFV